MANFQPIQHNSPQYHQAVKLRHRVLREPLGLAYTAEQLAAEHDQLHFAIVEGDVVIACLTAAQLDATQYKLRQMAVAADRQGEGWGLRLIEHVERVLGERGAKVLTLHARDYAIGFYEKLGYEAFGEPFVEVTIPHRKMRKQLA